MNIIKPAKEAGFTVTGTRIESPYIGGSDLSQRLAEFAAFVRADEQMKALEAARTIGGDWAVKFEQEYLK